MNKKGFTLVELLGTIVIIGLVIAGSAFGIIKLIDKSKSEGKDISVAGIEKSAGTYAEEKNDDEDYWQTMTRDDIDGLTGEYFCVTIGELQNKGLVDKNLDFNEISDEKNNIKIEKSTYVGIRKDMVTYVKSNPTLLDDSKYRDLSNGNYKEENIIYGVCTGNIVNEKISLITAEDGTSYTDEITDIKFDDVKSELDGVDIKIIDKKCTYSKGTSYSENNHKEGNVDWDNNKCSITDLESEKEYTIRVCERTEGGSQSCDDVTQITKAVNPPTVNIKNDYLEIDYSTNKDNIKGDQYYYFVSDKNATSNISVSTCTDKNNCSGSTTDIIAGKLYKTPGKVELRYNTSGQGKVTGTICDKTGNCADGSKDFVMYKTLFKKGEATTIGGGTADISKFCLAPLNGSCKVTSPSIAKEGYTAVGWNTNSSATTASWKAETEQAVSSDGTYYPILSIKVYNINYNANGGSGAPSGQTKKHGDSITLSTTKPTRSNYDFIGWNTASNGTGTSYASGATYSANADATLYAQWKANTCTITYDANGGRNAPSAQTVNCGSKATISRSTPSRSGYDFTGWNTNRYGSGTNYYSRSSYTINSDLYLYAQWEEEEEEPYFLLDYVSPPSTVLHGSYGSRSFDVGFSVSSNIGITTSDCYLEVYSSDCALKSSFGVARNCLNNSWMALSNAVINAYYYTNNDNKDSANASTNNAEHCITYRAYASRYGRRSDNTKTECYTIKR